MQKQKIYVMKNFIKLLKIVRVALKNEWEILKKLNKYQ